MSQMGKASPAALAELKQRVLWSLSKLSDRDTQQYAVEDLIAIVDRLTVDAIPTFLSCLYDTDLQQKSYARKESVRLLGIMAAVHGRLIGPHLSKIIANVVQHFKDQDSKVRDACAEAMGVIAAEAFPADESGTDGSMNPLGVFFRPLFEAMGEQNRNIQLTAAASLSRVIQCTNVPLASSLPRLCPRIVKSLSAPNFLAKAPLFDSVRSLVDVTGPDIVPFLPVLLPPVLASFASPDWQTRKAGAQVLQQMAASAGPAMSAHKEGVMAKLEKHRFDKVKAVRDSITDAIHSWKDVEDAPRPSSYSQYRLKQGVQSNSAESSDQTAASPSATSGNQNLKVGTDTATPESKPPETSESKPPELAETKPLQTPRTPLRPSLSRAPPSIGSRPPSSGTRGKRTSIRGMFRSGGSGDSDKWAVEVAVPRSARYEERPESFGGGGKAGGEGGEDESKRRLDMGSESPAVSQKWDKSDEINGEDKEKQSRMQEGDVRWAEGSDKRQGEKNVRAQENGGDAERKLGVHRLVDLSEGGKSPIELGRSSTRWMDSSVVRSLEEMKMQTGEGAGGLESGPTEVVGSTGSALEQSNGPHSDEAEKAQLKTSAGKPALAPSQSLTPVQPPAFQDEVKPSPRERRKWGQPEVEHLRGGERRPDSELLQLEDHEPDSRSAQQDKLAESSVGSPASSLLRNEALNGERAAEMQRTDFEREAVGAAEEFEKRLEKWGRLAQGLATSSESAERDWVEVKQQLARLELQQGRLMTMLQDMVTGSQTAINGVESRVSWIERRLEEALQQQPAYQGNGGMAGSPSARLLDGAFATAPLTRTARSSDGGVGRWNSTQVSSPHADLSPPHAEDSFPFRPSPLREHLSRRSLDEPPLQSSAHPRPQEPPSYQDARFPPADVSARPALSYADPSAGYADVSTRPYADVSNGASPPSRRSFSDLRRSGSFDGGGALDRTTPSHSRRGSGGGTEAAIRGGKAWTTAQEWLRHGKVEEAYLEVLSLGDELQLIRLLGRTGPVLSQLSAPTAAEVISVLAVLLKQESFLDVILPWMHQLADRKNDALLPRSLQREVVWALQVVAGQPTLSGSEAAKLVTTLCVLWAPAFVR